MQRTTQWQTTRNKVRKQSICHSTYFDSMYFKFATTFNSDIQKCRHNQISFTTNFEASCCITNAKNHFVFNTCHDTQISLMNC